MSAKCLRILSVEMIFIFVGFADGQINKISYRYMYLKTYAKFTFFIKSQEHVSDENFLYYCMHLGREI